MDVYLKNLEDGGKAVAFFNRSSAPVNIEFSKLDFIGIHGHQRARFVAAKELPDIADTSKELFKVNIAAHSVELYKFTAAK